METQLDEALRYIIREVVREELEPVLEALKPRPAVLDRHSLCEALMTSLTTVDRLCRQGMPHLRLGDQKRFELDRVLEWMRANAEKP